MRLAVVCLCGACANTSKRIAEKANVLPALEHPVLRRRPRLRKSGRRIISNEKQASDRVCRYQWTNDTQEKAAEGKSLRRSSRLQTIKQDPKKKEEASMRRFLYLSQWTNVICARLQGESSRVENEFETSKTVRRLNGRRSVSGQAITS